MALKLLLSKLKKFLAKSFIIDKSTKDSSEQGKKKRLSLLQYILKHFLLKKILKKKAKHNLKSKKPLKKDRTKSPVKQSDNPKENLTHIQKIMQTYEEFIQRDFSMTIKEVNSKLKEWKTSIINRLSKKAELSNQEIEILSHSIQEISDLYQNTEMMLTNFSNDFSQYKAVVRDAQRKISPEHKLNQLNSQINKIISGLEKGKHLLDLESNHDYKFISRYIDKTSKSRSLSL